MVWSTLAWSARPQSARGTRPRDDGGVAVGGVAIGLWVGLFVWGALATVVAAFAGALHPAWQAVRAMPRELIRTTIS